MSRPLLLVGPTGSGKTTLARTLTQATEARGHRVVVSTARDWAARYVEALAGGAPGPDDFHGADLAVIEHLEDLVGRRHTLEALAGSLVRCAGAGGCVVATATIPRAFHDVPRWIRVFSRALGARVMRQGMLPIGMQTASPPRA